MALSKETVIDKIEVLENGAIQVRRATYIVEDGVRIAGPIYVRAAYTPDADVATEAQLVKDLADVVWTPEVIQAYRDKIEAAQGRK